MRDELPRQPLIKDRNSGRESQTDSLSESQAESQADAQTDDTLTPAEPPRKRFFKPSPIAIIAASLCFFWAAFICYEGLSFSKKAVSTKATVINVRCAQKFGNGCYSTATYTYTDHAGNRYENSVTTRNRFWFGSYTYKIGDVIDVLYLPDDPTKSMPRSAVLGNPLGWSLTGVIILIWNIVRNILSVKLSKKPGASKEDLADYARREKMAYDNSQNAG